MSFFRIYSMVLAIANIVATPLYASEPTPATILSESEKNFLALAWTDLAIALIEGQQELLFKEERFNSTRINAEIEDASGANMARAALSVFADPKRLGDMIVRDSLNITQLAEKLS